MRMMTTMQAHDASALVLQSWVFVVIICFMQQSSSALFSFCPLERSRKFPSMDADMASASGEEEFPLSQQSDATVTSVELECSGCKIGSKQDGPSETKKAAFHQREQIMAQ